VDKNKQIGPTESLVDKYKNICRFMVFVLRHKPKVAGLTLDQDGYAETTKVLSSIDKRFKLKLTQDELISVTKKYAANLFYFDGMKVKAKFGHTVILNLNVPESFERIEKTPKDLFGCIDKNDFFNVSKGGLQFSAVQFGLIDNRSKLPSGRNVVVYVNAEKASKNNIFFHYNKDSDKYFCKFIPSTFIHIEIG
jgi:putative RNA 2'-phosphotransferase